VLFLVVFAGAWVGAYVLRRPLRRWPWLFYALAGVLDAVGLVGSSAGLPRWLWMALFELEREALLPLALFAVVMFIGCFRKESFVGRSLLPVRSELSILACILSLEHVAAYLQSYLPRIAALSAASPMVVGGFVVAVALLVLLAILGTTSLKLVRRAMPSRLWKAVQRLAYPFFVLVFVHVLFMLAPSAMNGGTAAQVSVVVYAVLWGVYAALRIGRFLADRREPGAAEGPVDLSGVRTPLAGECPEGALSS